MGALGEPSSSSQALAAPNSERQTREPEDLNSIVDFERFAKHQWPSLDVILAATKRALECRLAEKVSAGRREDLCVVTKPKGLLNTKCFLQSPNRSKGFADWAWYFNLQGLHSGPEGSRFGYDPQQGAYKEFDRDPASVKLDPGGFLSDVHLARVELEAAVEASQQPRPSEH
jgi:hypothetical protein